MPDPARKVAQPKRPVNDNPPDQPREPGDGVQAALDVEVDILRARQSTDKFN